MSCSSENKTLFRVPLFVRVALWGIAIFALGLCLWAVAGAGAALADEGQSGLTAGEAADRDEQDAQSDQDAQGEQDEQGGTSTATSGKSSDRASRLSTQEVSAIQPGDRATSTLLFSYGWSDGGYCASTSAVVADYDVTGDGAADQLAITLVPLGADAPGLVGSVSLSVNGQVAYELAAASAGIDRVSLTHLRLVNGQVALFLSAYDADGTAMQALLCYQSGAFAKVVGNDLLYRTGVSDAHISAIVPSGNRLVVEFDFTSSVTGNSRTSFVYLGKGGSFVRESDTTSALRYATTSAGAFTKQLRKAASSFAAYTDASLSQVAFTVPEGKKVRPLALQLSGDRLLYKVKYGKQIGWIAAPDPIFIKGGKLLRSVYGKLSLSTKLPEYSESGALGLSLLQKLSNHTLYLARNEIYARHGYVFKDAELAGYFAAQSWYVPDPNATVKLTSIETKNVTLMFLVEKNRRSPYVS